MENQPSILLQFVPLLVLSLGLGFQALFLAKDKGRNVVLWAIVGFMPFVNFFCIWYLIGASNLRHEQKLDEILSRLQK